ncbi:MAG: hypothetical protein ACI837_001662 [Crocinitomicaceae bacterium]|jgi:uncharacterized protein (DUF2141 family)
MKRILRILVVLPAAFILVSVKAPEQNSTCSLKVRVTGLRNSIGIVQFTIYNKDGTIPDEKFKKYYKKKTAKIVKNGSYTTFYELPKGKYAINILHDENKNGKIDKGFIMPIEGIGFSNFKSIGFTNRPNFKKASFFLSSDLTKTVKVIYM